MKLDVICTVFVPPPSEALGQGTIRCVRKTAKSYY